MHRGLGHWIIVLPQYGSCHLDGGDIDGERVPRGQPPSIKVKSIRHLMGHGLAAGLCLHVRGSALPSLEVAECLLDIPTCELHLDRLSNTCRMIDPILSKGGMNLVGEVAPAHLA